MGKILCACMLMIFVNMSSRTVFAQSHYMEIDSLLIHYVDFNLMTMIDIGIKQLYFVIQVALQN